MNVALLKLLGGPTTPFTWVNDIFFFPEFDSLLGIDPVPGASPTPHSISHPSKGKVGVPKSHMQEYPEHSGPKCSQAHTQNKTTLVTTTTMTAFQI